MGELTDASDAGEVECRDWDKTLAESSPRAPTTASPIVGVKCHGQDFTYALPETRIEGHDQLIVSGPPGSSSSCTTSPDSPGHRTVRDSLAEGLLGWSSPCDDVNA